MHKIIDTCKKFYAKDIIFVETTRPITDMKRILLLLAVLVFSGTTLAKPQTLFSPDGRIQVVITTDAALSYDVLADGVPVMTGNRLSLTLADRVLGPDAKLQKAIRSSLDEIRHPVVPLKFSSVQNRCNILTLKFKGGWQVEFRAYDDGIAYRFVTALGGSIDVMDEEIGIRFAREGSYTLQECKRFFSDYEEKYTHPAISEWEQMAHLPILAGFGEGRNVFISESNVSDYPAAFYCGTGEGGLKATFPKDPVAFGPDGDRALEILETAPYLTRTAGTRSFPWRYFVLTRTDGDLL